MKAKKEQREDRDDVYSIWIDEKYIKTENGVDSISVREKKIDEFTLIDLDKKIKDKEKELVDKQKEDKDLKDKKKLVEDLIKAK